MYRVQGLLQDLKSFDATVYGVEELIALQVNAEALQTGFKRYDLDVPFWLKDALTKIDIQIKEKTREQMMAALREAEMEENRLKSRDERRTEVKERAAKLRERLGITSS